MAETNAGTLGGNAGSNARSNPSEKPKLTLARKFNAPPEAVWRAWTEPEALKHWFGPDAGAVSTAETDVRVGGRFHIVFKTLDGEQHDVSGTYREVQKHRKLVFTWAWISTPERVSQVTLSFVPSGGATEFTLLHEQFYDMAARDGHERGWTGSLEKLQAFIEKQGH
jgi:uncharacterized protein YndB with AHSA1/START domain